MLANIQVHKLVWNDVHPLQSQGLGASSGEAFKDPTLANLLRLINLLLNSFNHKFVIDILELSQTVSDSLASRGLSFSSRPEHVSTRNMFPLEVLSKSA